MKFIDIFKNYFDKKREEIVRNNPSEAVSTTVSAKASNNVAATTQGTTASPDLSTMTVASLKGVAKDRGLKGYSKLRKADLIRLLS